MKRRSDLAVLLPALLFVGAFAIFPVAILFGQALWSAGGTGALAATALAPLNVRAIGNSLVQGGLSAGIAVLVGYPVGLFFGRYDWPGRALLRSFLLVPFLLPSLVVVLGIVDLFGPAGVVSTVLPGLAFLGEGLPGIVAANLVFNIPLVVLLTAAGAETSSPSLEETVAVLGGAPWRAYRDAWGPPTWVGAAAGGLLTFLFSALSFAPPLLLCGARCYTVEAQVWSLDQVAAEPNSAAVLALVLVLLFLLPTAAYLFLLRQLRALPGGRRAAPRRARRRPLDLALGSLTIAVALGEFSVLAAVLYRTVVPSGGGGAGSAWVSLFSGATAARLGIPALGLISNTLLFAAGASVVTLLLGIVLGYSVVGRPARASAVGLFLFAPLLISPVVLAFSLATFWRPLLGGEANVWLLVIVSQAVLALPFALQSIEIPLAGLPSAPREAARTLGSAPWAAFLDVDLPRVRSGVATAGLFAFAIGLGEFTATFFLVTPQYTTLPVALYRLSYAREFAVADAAAGLLLLLSLAIFALLFWGGRRVAL